MARAIPVKSKTVVVRSTVTVGGMSAGQIAEVDDSQKTRDLISAGLWVLLISKTAAPEPVVVTPAEEPVLGE